MLDVIGYSTAPEDIEVAKDRLDQLIGWLLSVPWWVVIGLALLSTLWLIWVSWPRPTRINQMDAPPINSAPPPMATDSPRKSTAEEAALIIFAVDYAMPACTSRIRLQEEMVTILTEGWNDILKYLAKSGLRYFDGNATVIYDNVDSLSSAFCELPRIAMSFDELTTRICAITIHYGFFCSNIDVIADVSAIDYRTHPQLKECFEAWREKHNSFVHEYEKLRRDHRFPKLFFPGQPSWVGEIIPPSEA